jgi:hypothetical protein
MADAVTSIVTAGGPRIYSVRLTNISDGTGETLVTKINLTTLTMPPGTPQPTSCGIEEIQWISQGFTSIRLYFDHSTDDVAALLSGNGYRCFEPTGVLGDPKSAGGNGNILLSTAGAVSGATYDILLTVRLV